MGSWTATCGVTQLPIEKGEDVALILLTNSSYPGNYSGHYYPNFLWSPRALPILGKYNVVGSIKTVKDWNSEFIINGFKLDMVENQENNILKTGLTVDNIIEWIDNDQLSVQNQRKTSEVKAIGSMMVHAETYKLLSKRIENSWSTKTLLWEQIASDGIKLYSAIKNAVASGNHKSILMLFLLPDRLVEKDNFFQNSSVFSGLSIGSIDSSGIGTGIRDYRDYFIGLLEQNTDESDRRIVQAFESLARFIVFNENFASLRKTYMPQSAKGSTDYNWKLASSLNTCVTNMINGRKENDWDQEDSVFKP